MNRKRVALRDHYLPAALGLILLACSAIATAQGPPQRVNGYGFIYRGIGADRSLYFPKDTTVGALDSTYAHLATKGGSLYFFDKTIGDTWQRVTSSTPSWGTITGTLSSQTDLAASLAAKQAKLPLGTSAQYWSADGALRSFDSSARLSARAAVSATSPLLYAAGVFSIQQASSSQNGYLSSSAYANFLTAYNQRILSATVTGTTNKTLQLNRQDGTQITASWTDLGDTTGGSAPGVTGVDFSTASGDLNLYRDGYPTLTQNLDGRYLREDQQTNLYLLNTARSGYDSLFWFRDDSTAQSKGIRVVGTGGITATMGGTDSTILITVDGSAISGGGSGTDILPLDNTFTGTNKFSLPITVNTTTPFVYSTVPASVTLWQEANQVGLYVKKNSASAYSPMEFADENGNSYLRLDEFGRLAFGALGSNAIDVALQRQSAGALKVVNTTNNQNGDLYAGNIVASSQIYASTFGIVTTETGSISAPPSGKGLIWAKSDGTIHYKNSSGTDFDLTLGGSGVGSTTTLQQAIDAGHVLDKNVLIVNPSHYIDIYAGDSSNAGEGSELWMTQTGVASLVSRTAPQNYRMLSLDDHSILLRVNPGYSTATPSSLLMDTSGSTIYRNFRLHAYGSGTKTGTAAYNLAVDASGNVIEAAIGSGGGATPGIAAVLTASNQALGNDINGVGQLKAAEVYASTAFTAGNSPYSEAGFLTSTGVQVSAPNQDSRLHAYNLEFNIYGITTELRPIINVDNRTLYLPDETDTLATRGFVRSLAGGGSSGATTFEQSIINSNSIAADHDLFFNNHWFGLNGTSTFYASARSDINLEQTTGGSSIGGGLSLTSSYARLYTGPAAVKYFSMDVNGALQANGYGSGTITGTAAYGLSVDASGNIIETALGGGGSTPNLQAVLTAGNTATSHIQMPNDGTGGYMFTDANGASTGMYSSAGGKIYFATQGMSQPALLLEPNNVRFGSYGTGWLSGTRGGYAPAFTSNGSLLDAPMGATKVTSYTVSNDGAYIYPALGTILVNASGGATTLQLAYFHDISVDTGGKITIKKTDASGNAVTISGVDYGYTIDGANTKSLTTQYQYITLQFTGSAWVVVGGN